MPSPGVSELGRRARCVGSRPCSAWLYSSGRRVCSSGRRVGFACSGSPLWAIDTALVARAANTHWHFYLHPASPAALSCACAMPCRAVCSAAFWIQHDWSDVRRGPDGAVVQLQGRGGPTAPGEAGGGADAVRYCSGGRGGRGPAWDLGPSGVGRTAWAPPLHDGMAPTVAPHGLPPLPPPPSEGARTRPSH